METWDPLTGQSKGYNTQVAVKACGPLVSYLYHVKNNVE